MPTINMGVGDTPANAIPYWKLPAEQNQQAGQGSGSLPPPAQAAVALRNAGEAIFAPPQAPVSSSIAAVSTAAVATPVAAANTDEKVLCRVAIGSDGPSPYNEDDDELLKKDGPNLNLATVAGHMINLQRMLHNDGSPIAIDAFQLITDITDSIDQVFYWGIAESRFPESPFSALCECEVVETLTPVLRNDRPLLVLAALKALTSVLEHPMACRRFARGKGSFEALFTALIRFPAKEELVADAIAVCRSAAPGNVEEFLASDCLSGVISGMQRHADNLEIQKRGAMLFADLIGMPRHDLEAVPISILFVHIGQIVEFVLNAAKQQQTSSQVSDAVAHFLEVASSRPENIKKLMQNADFLPTVEATATKGTNLRNPKAIVSSLATIGNLIPALTLRGKMRMSTILRDVMVKSTDVSVLMTCFALQHALLVSAKMPPPNLPEPPKEEGDDGEGDSKEPQLTRPKHVLQQQQAMAMMDPMQAYMELKQHMTEEQVPQCILIALDHFGEEGDQLHAVGTAAVSEMAMRRFHWQ